MAAKRSGRPKRRHSAESRHAVRLTKRNSDELAAETRQYLDQNGYLSWSARTRKYVILGTNSPKDGLVTCPECRTGMLMVIRSPATRKRFIGCSNYRNGCGASSPLLQRAMLRATKLPCGTCTWPMILFRYSTRKKWERRCSNIKCTARS